MKIRSITSFIDPKKNSTKVLLQSLSQLSQELTKQFTDAGFEVESIRIAAPPLAYYLPEKTQLWTEKIRDLESLVLEYGWTYFSAGSATVDRSDSYEIIPELILATRSTFFNAVISDQKQVYPVAARSCSKIIKAVSTIQENGFSNLHFAALANVTPYAPFFPAAYGLSGAAPAFSIAIECADEVVATFTEAKTLVEAKGALLATLEQKADRLLRICSPLSEKFGVEFKGFDFSPAPFPEDWCSLGKAFEVLGLEYIGGFGSLTAAAYIADTLDKGRWKKVGFNGLMLAVMEDSILAERAAQGLLSVRDLLLYSAVCGTGLDTIPLAGETSENALANLLLDLGSLATRLGKPLTGRLMPIPGKRVGEKTEFDFGYFANSRIMALDEQNIRSPLMGSEPIQLTPRN